MRAPADFNRTVESTDFSFPLKFLIIANGMNLQFKTAAAILAGVGIGIAAMHGLQGGQAKAPPAVESKPANKGRMKTSHFFRLNR
jgi:hypothetical protein